MTFTPETYTYDRPRAPWAAPRRAARQAEREARRGGFGFGGPDAEGHGPYAGSRAGHGGFGDGPGFADTGARGFRASADDAFDDEPWAGGPQGPGRGPAGHGGPGSAGGHGRGGPGGRGGRGGWGGWGGGPEGPFGPHGVFGPDGPFGARGPFGSDGPFGGGFGRGRRAGGRARRGEVRLAALHLIAEEPRNGYQIIQALEQRTGGAWKPSPGAIYPALSQLEDEGLIEAVEVDGRKAFIVTDAGREQVEAHGDRPKPWEPEDSEPADSRRGAVGDLWNAFGQVAMAAKAVTQTGDPDLARAAGELLEQTRRDLYRLLADGDAGRENGGRDGDGQGDDVQDTVPER